MQIDQAKQGVQVRHKVRGIGKIDFVWLERPKGEVAYGISIDPGPFPQMGVTFASGYGATYNANEIASDFILAEDAKLTFAERAGYGMPLGELLKGVKVTFTFEHRSTSTLADLLPDGLITTVVRALENESFHLHGAWTQIRLDEFDSHTFVFTSLAKGSSLASGGLPHTQLSLDVDGYWGICKFNLSHHEIP